jgi:hypothetical protein
MNGWFLDPRAGFARILVWAIRRQARGALALSASWRGARLPPRLARVTIPRKINANAAILLV